MKKAQIEIIGLLVIVVLLSVALLLAIRFILREENDVLMPQKESIMASSFTNTLFSTHTSFSSSENLRIKDLIENCVSINSCEDVKTEISFILNEILKNKRFFLIIEEPSGKKYIEIYSHTEPALKCSQDSLNLITSNGKVSINPEINYKFGLCK